MESEISIFSIGGATMDVFLSGKALAARRDVKAHEYVEQFPLGEKIDIEEMFFDTGGGATNAAVTFARQGYRSGLVGKVGKDISGDEIMRALGQEDVALEHIVRDSESHSSYSTILLAPNGERTILKYHGASDKLKVKDVKVEALSVDWLYVTTLGGNIKLLEKIIKHAGAHNIKIALNPGAGEIAKGKKLRKLIPALTVLIANKDEMQDIFGGISYKEIITKAASAGPTIVMTDGANGAYACDGTTVFFAGLYQNAKVVDRTGAGDAFGSGFIAALARKESVPQALSFAAANASSVVQRVGSKGGILHTRKVKPLRIKIAKL